MIYRSYYSVVAKIIEQVKCVSCEGINWGPEGSLRIGPLSESVDVGMPDRLVG